MKLAEHNPSQSGCACITRCRRQHIRECFLAYCCLLAAGKELTGKGRSTGAVTCSLVMLHRHYVVCTPCSRPPACPQSITVQRTQAGIPAVQLADLSPLAHRCSTAAEPDLDTKCERLLRRHFNLPLDFTAEQAIPALGKWGLVVRQADGRLHAQPLPAALAALDAVWDGIYDFPAAASMTTSAAKEAVAAAGAAGHAAVSVGMDGQRCGTVCAGGEVAAEQAETGDCGDEDGWQLAAVGGISADGMQPDQSGLEGQDPAGVWEAAPGAAGPEAAPLQQMECCLEPGSWAEAGVVDVDAAELESGPVGTNMLQAAAALQGGAAEGWLADVAAGEAGSAAAGGSAEAAAVAGEIQMHAMALDGEPGAGWEQAAAEAEREGAAAVPAELLQMEADAAGAAGAADAVAALSTEGSSLSLPSSSSSSSLEFVSLRSVAAGRGPARLCGATPAAAAATGPGSSPTHDRGAAVASPFKCSPNARLSPQQLRWLRHRGR